MVEGKETGTEISESEVALSDADDPHAADLTRVSEVAQRLLAAGKWELNASGFETLSRPNGGNELTICRFGMAMASLRVTCRRVLRNGSKIRVYDIRNLPRANH